MVEHVPPRPLRSCSVLTLMSAALLAAVGELAGPTTGDCLAQSATPAALERPGQLAPEKREELYRQLRSQAEVLEAQASVVKTVAKLIGPTVVHIEADVTPRSAPHFGPRKQIEEAGSGVIVEIGGKHYILTNRHVIDGATTAGIRIRLADGRQIRPSGILVDPETDTGVMAVSAPDLVAAPIGDSDRMEIGDFVLALGSPFGLSHSVTYGIISAKGRRDLELGDSGVRLQDFLQTDAAINPGNSGGPLINLRGEVIGINTAIASNSGGSEGIGFSIPINMFMVVARQLVERGQVTRAFLGVTLDRDFGPAVAAELGLPRPIGARIIDLTEKSPAAIANLQRGDVILQFNSVPVEDDAHLVNLVNLTEVGKEVSLLVYRDRQTQVVKVRVGDRGAF
ncbi:MAG: trypsin-like peptidase domain-containing protein [Pirellulales bacterium]|nr:trypsin-like peptidase domain-containing protein [Pirellulales bacterium]